MAQKLFTQSELNHIVASRLKRERERMARDYEDSLKRCMAQIHLMLYQEMCSTKRDMAAETNDPFWSQRQNKLPPQQPAYPACDSKKS